MRRVQALTAAALLVSMGTARAQYIEPSFIEERSPLVRVLWFLGPGH